MRKVDAGWRAIRCGRHDFALFNTHGWSWISQQNFAIAMFGERVNFAIHANSSPSTTRRHPVMSGITPSLIGLLLGYGVGAGCRFFNIPSPAPPRFLGACMLLAMTLGFVAADHLLQAHSLAMAGAVMTKTIIGLLVAFSVGFACRAFGIPSPAPPLIMGALLVMAMTVGYLLVDRVMRRPSQHAEDHDGSSTPTCSAAPRESQATRNDRQP